jgi:hypothetical protein
MPGRDAQEKRPCARDADGSLISSAQARAACCIDADHMRPLLDEQPDLLTGSQVRDERAIDVESCRAGPGPESLVARHDEQGEARPGLREIRRVNPVRRNRCRGRARHRGRAAGDGKNCRGSCPQDSHASRLSGKRQSTQCAAVLRRGCQVNRLLDAHFSMNLWRRFACVSGFFALRIHHDTIRT